MSAVKCEHTFASEAEFWGHPTTISVDSFLDPELFCVPAGEFLELGAI